MWIQLILYTGKGWMVTRDPDNILKHTIDSVVDAGIIEGDTVQFVARASVEALLPEHKQSVAKLIVRVSLEENFAPEL